MFLASLSRTHTGSRKFRSIREFVASTEGIRGVAALEFALVVPFLLLMIVGIVDIGMGIYRKMQVQNAAQAGAQYAISHGYSPSIADVVTNATTFPGIAATPAPGQFCGCPSNSGVATATCGSICVAGSTAGTYVVVSAMGTYNTIMSYPAIPGSFEMTAQATVRVQ